jgi:hypothetical protein
MALFPERMLRCAQKTFDTADIVRDGDLTTTMRSHGDLGYGETPTLVRKIHLRCSAFQIVVTDSDASECFEGASRILLSNPDNGVTRSFMPYL